MKGKNRNHRGFVAAVLTAIAVSFFFPQMAGGLTVQAAEKLTVSDALANIYQDQANVPVSDYSGIGSKIRDSYLKDVLAGKYEENAVACYLDHGYFKSSYQKIKDAGVLSDDYTLPDYTYYITRTSDLLPQAEPTNPPADRHVLVTDSPYLQTYQLLQIANVHAFDEASLYKAELLDYNDSYVDKADQDKALETEDETTDTDDTTDDTKTEND